jgi:hypothetical protein
MVLLSFEEILRPTMTTILFRSRCKWWTELNSFQISNVDHVNLGPLWLLLSPPPQMAKVVAIFFCIAKTSLIKTMKSELSKLKKKKSFFMKDDNRVYFSSTWTYFSLICNLGDTGEYEKPSYRPILTWQTTVRKVPWGVIILLGGGFALADASKVSVCILATLLISVINCNTRW